MNTICNMAWNYKIIVNVISSLVTGYDRFFQMCFQHGIRYECYELS